MGLVNTNVQYSSVIVTALFYCFSYNILFFHCSLFMKGQYLVLTIRNVCTYLFIDGLIIVCNEKNVRINVILMMTYPHEWQSIIKQNTKGSFVFLKTILMFQQQWHQNCDNIDEWQVSHCVRVRVTWDFRFIYNKLNTQENIWRFVVTTKQNQYSYNIYFNRLIVCINEPRV